jgi:DNA-binding transcriptional LysR family regulator
MNYTLNQLQVFLKVVQLSSVTKAAEELNLTQPAVSIQLKNFQDQFEIPLTEVVGRKIYITEFGREIAQSAEAILDQVYAINNKTRAYQGQLFGLLKISVVSTGKYIMPYFLADFVKNNPGIDLKIDVTNRLSVLESMERNETDFALVSILPENLKVEKIELLPNKLYLVGKAGTTDSDGVQPVGKMPLIFRENGSGTRKMMEKFIEKHDVPFTRRIELTSNEAVKQSILAGLGYSIMPLIGLRHELQQGELAIIPYDGLPLLSSWYLIWLKGKKLSPVAQAFESHVKTQKRHIIDNQFSWYEHF